ncbi:NYN domain-containing protein [Chloroflexota bacterium]
MDIKTQLTDKQIAVLIDLENVGLNRIQWLFDQISDVGRIIVKKAYADWSAESHKRDQLLELGIEPIHLFRSTKGGKNASDIRLAIDAADLLYTSPVDTFVIVSSDSDFVPLVSKLRAAGKIVFGAGEQNKAPSTLVKSCDRYFYLDQDRSIRKRSRKRDSVSKETDAENLIKRAVMASMDEHGRVVGSKLHQMILRLDPSFDYRSYGYSTFTKFLEAFPGLKLIPSKGPGDVIIELPEQTPQAIAELTPSKELWEQIDSAWSKRVEKYGESVPGPMAAADAATALGVDKLSKSQYKTLQGLINASEYLSEKWLREGNTIKKRS